MIILSDNTATNVVIDAIGMANATARMKALGLGDILLRRKMMDGAAVRRGDENVASPASLAKVAELLWRGEGLQKQSRDTAVRILHQVPGSHSPCSPWSRARGQQDRHARRLYAPRLPSSSSRTVHLP